MRSLRRNTASHRNGIRSAGLLLALACALQSISIPTFALAPGKWTGTLACGPREDLTPVRPGFSAQLPGISSSNQQFTLARTYKEPKNTVTEEWRGVAAGTSLVATATARRDNGDVWNYELRGPNSEATSIRLQGFMSANGQRIRNCTLDLALAEPDRAPQAAAPAPAARPAPAAAAAAPQVTVGVQSSVSLRLNLDPALGRCNIEVVSPGIGNREYEVSAPSYEVQVPVLAAQEGNATIQWRGKTKIRGLNSVQGCPGSGTLLVVARPGEDQTRAKWAAVFGRLTPEQAECLRFGIAHRNLRIESIDPSAALVSPESPEAKAVFAKCDSFLARSLRTDYECTVLNGVRSRCEERYAEDRDGRLVSIRRDDALRRHFDDQPLRVAGFETPAAVEARKQEEAQRESQRRQAEERRREQEAAARAAAAARNAARSAPPAAATPPAPPPNAAPAAPPRAVRGE